MDIQCSVEMAANSGGVDWGTVINPIISTALGDYHRIGSVELAKAIIKSEHELLNHEEEYETFFVSFAALAADIISSDISYIWRSQVPQACQAAKILLQFFLSRLRMQQTCPAPGEADPTPPLSAKQLLVGVRVLCSDHASLQSTEQTTLIALLKGARMPSSTRTTAPGEKEPSQREATRARADVSSSILERLTTPIHDFGKTSLIGTGSTAASDAAPTNPSENFGAESGPGNEVIFIARNVTSLQSLGAGDLLLDLCLGLPHLSRYVHKYREAVSRKSLSPPSSQSEATSLRHSLPALVYDLTLTWNVLSLPVLEPLTPEKLQKLNSLTMGALYSAVCTATAGCVLGVVAASQPKSTAAANSVRSEEEALADSLSVTVVEKALEIFTLVSTAIRNSTRAGGHVAQNHLLIGVWVLMTGLQAQLSASSSMTSEKSTSGKEDKGKSPSRVREGSSRVNLTKVQQGFGVLSVALASRALTMLSALLEDLQVEGSTLPIGSASPCDVQPADLDILGQPTALQRAARVFTAVPLNQLLYYLATISYRKACTLKRIQKHPPEGDNFDTSDSTTYYEDDLISCSEESPGDDDDDSEPILGQWFEETISFPDMESSATGQNSSNNQDANKTVRNSDGPNAIVPEKGEPNGYIALATQIFQFMNVHLVGSDCAYIWQYLQAGLTEHQMVVLAAIVRDLDRETARTDTGTISVYFGAALGLLYSEFSHALAQYCHNLLARSVLSPALQGALLTHLGVSPISGSDGVIAPWPLQLYRHTLAILAQVLLLKPAQEKEPAFISIWQRLLNTLVQNVCSPPSTLDSDNEDLNIEHAQLLLFLFHSLNLMQKKMVLLAAASGLVKCTDDNGIAVRSTIDNGGVSSPLRESQLLHLSRILLLLEYFIKHLYEAPPVLLEQMQWNLFSAVHPESSEKNGDSVNNLMAFSRMYTAWGDIEMNYVKLGPQDEFSMRPRFYCLASPEYSNQDQPKLDGLACNFILGTPDKLTYSEFLEALLDVLGVVNMCDPSTSYLALCASQYCFAISWRLLLLLPPSMPCMDRLSFGENIPASTLLLHCLVWGPRASCKTFSGWMKDCLVKQGVYTSFAENLLRNVSRVVHNVKYDVQVAKSCIQELMPTINSSGSMATPEHFPPILDLCLLHAVMARVLVQFDDSIAQPTSDSADSKGSSTEVVVSKSDLVLDLLPSVLDLIDAVLACIRASLMHQANEGVDRQDVRDFRQVLQIASSRSLKTSALASALIGQLPRNVRSTLDKWHSLPLLEFPWNTYANDVIPAESYLLAVVNAVVSTLSSECFCSVNSPLKNLLHALVTFVADQSTKHSLFQSGGAHTELRTRVINALVPITLDASTEYLQDTVQRSLEKLLGETDSEEHERVVLASVLEHVYALIMNYTKSTRKVRATVDVGILQECMTFLDGLLERPAGRSALDAFFDLENGRGALVKVLLSISAPQTAHSPQYGTRVLRFFNKLFAAEEKNKGEVSLSRLCHAATQLATTDSATLQTWLRHVIWGGSPAMTSSDSTCAATPVTAVPDSHATEAEAAATSPTDATPVTNGATSVAVNSPAEDQQTLVQENSALLRSLSNYMLRDKGTASEEAAMALLTAIIPLGPQVLETGGMPELMPVLTTLAEAGSGNGHVDLLAAATNWLVLCKQYLCQPEVLEQVESSATPGSHVNMLDSTCCLLNYVGDVIACISSPGAHGQRATSPPWENDAYPDLDADWADDIVHEDDDSSAEDSDEDSLCNKLCTFTVTQKDFMSQHWYHCHTCKMVDGVGVCTVCAKVCHRGHDVTYAKYGNFFCDCGAKVGGNCQALVKRNPQMANDQHGVAASGQSDRAGSAGMSAPSGGAEQMLTSSLRRRASSPVNLDRALRGGRDQQRLVTLQRQLESLRDKLTSMVIQPSNIAPLLELLNSLYPAVEASCARLSPVGCHQRAQAALKTLHTQEKTFEHTDQLMVPTLGSQEGAFENVRMNYNGDQGQTIRQLLSAHMIRRVAMCCLSSPHGKRQHLAVSHEKGKITVLQLSALLKQADSLKRKLTLTRLASAPIPFTVLSVTGNPWNEDFLAVCGLKDCHVLTFSSSGAVADHLVLHPQLETGNFIIRAIWLPGSQTNLALVTADFVKIYDLSKDALSPQYCFVVPAGKIRDCTFACLEEGSSHMLLMSSAGYIYTQAMGEESLAKYGPFYVTNTLDVFHPDIKDVNGQECGGGISIYYSHALQLLFFSYTQGKSFVAPLKYADGTWTLPTVFPIQLSSSSSKPNNGSNKTGSSPQPQPLCQWSEVPNHPGLICSMMQSSNNPVILMVKPDSILVQEIKVVPAKAKIMDMVAIRHQSSSAEHRTTLILLCEDGSLRIYMAAMEQTGFWLSAAVPASSPGSTHRPYRKKKAVKTNKPTGSVSFPVDFFEHCQAMNDVEFGGNDLLQVYNTAQVKHRLNTTGMYVVATKQSGFVLEVYNSDSSLVMTGIRVLLGSQDHARAPAYIEVFGRIIPTNVTRNRWFDIPLTREESLQADKKLVVNFGPSADPEGVTMIDSVKVYGKTKDALGWPEETEDVTSSTAAPAAPAVGTPTDNEATGVAAAPAPLSQLDKVVSGLLEVVDGCFTLAGPSALTDEDRVAHRSLAINVATSLLTLPTPTCVQVHTKCLLGALHPTRTAYHNYKDQALLCHVQQALSQLRSMRDPRDMDAEAFYRLVLTARGVAVARPHNLARFAVVDLPLDRTLTDDSESAVEGEYDESGCQHLIVHLMSVLWSLHEAHPPNMALAPVCVPGLTHTETTVHALVEIIHAFTLCDVEGFVALAAKMYHQMLLQADPAVSFSAKHALVKVLRPRNRRRRVYIPSPPHCSTPGGMTEIESEKGPVSQPSQDSSEAEPHFDTDQVEPVLLRADANAAGSAGVSGGASNANQVLNPVEALLGGPLAGANFPPLLDIPPDADDETMVELAIALSLQDHDGAADLQSIQQGLQQGLANLQVLHNLSAPALHSLRVLAAQGLAQVQLASQGQEGGHYSDTTASAAGSDDEGSTAATDGSTLRTSPAEQGGSAGSESGGSGVDSITGDHNVSGRSSAYGDNIQESLAGARSETSSLGAPAAFQERPLQPANSVAHEPDGILEPEPDPEPDAENSVKLHQLRLLLLERLLQYMPQLKNVGGMRSIPFMQVILMLTSDLDGEDEKDRACLENALSVIIGELNMSEPDFDIFFHRTPQREVHLVIMRLLSVLMSRPKLCSKNNHDSSNFVSQTTATMLLQAKVIDYCLTMLKYLLSYWKTVTPEEPTQGGGLLKPHLPTTPPDMTPFFLRQYVKGHAGDVLEAYPHLLTEMALRLPYQVLKHAENSPPISVAFDQVWFHYLCEYMLTQQTPFVRRQVRKLLLFICGNKDKYRQLRDLHSLATYVKSVQDTLKGSEATTFPYDTLVGLMEQLKSCVEVATSRTANWQLYCVQDPAVLSFLLQASCTVDDSLAPPILQLLECAVCPSKEPKAATPTLGGPSPPTGSTEAAPSPPSSARKEREKSEEAETKSDEAQCVTLVRQLNKQVPKEQLSRFIKTFLLETNATTVRWQAHTLLQAIYKSSLPAEKEALLDLMWELWPVFPVYGRKAAQFVDILGYFSLKTPVSSKKMSEYIWSAVAVLRTQNSLLAKHPNAALYSHLSQYVELDGYYLESEPCLVCNNPELPLASIKLSGIKIDSKFTTTTQIVKLVGSHTISRITLRIGDLKRTKMVRTINIYYNNRTVQAVVELKNKPAMWHKAKKVTLSSGQTEVKIDFPLPIVACNLMIEYADFYENIQASSETLQCPRCSASVPANPGVCANCGENVYQCHKCRAINYDEKDPFLCHACGFCKYAKFDYTVTARPCCAVDPIENDEDRNKTIATINSHLEKADRVYKQLISNKPHLEMLLLKISEHRQDRAAEDLAAGGASTALGTQVNRAIQLVAQRYCGECRSSFEELSKIIQRVLACRRELVAYDRSQREQTPPNSSSKEGVKCAVTWGHCYGCAAAATEHCLTLLRALACSSTSRQVLCAQGLVAELADNNLRRGTSQVQEEVRQLLCLLTRDNTQATEELCMLIMGRISLTLRGHLASADLSASVRHEMALLAALVQKEDTRWEQKLRCVMQLFLMACKNSSSPVLMESVILPCLKILSSYVKPGQASSKKNKDKSVNELATVVPMHGVFVDVQKWLEGDGNHSYAAWKQHMPRRNSDASAPSVSSLSKKDVHELYLMEKYGHLWRRKVLCRPVPLQLSDAGWLKPVIFNPSLRFARILACNMLEGLSRVPAWKKDIVDLLTGCLSEIGQAGEDATDFIALYEALLFATPWKQYLAVRGVLLHLADLLTKEIEQLHALEENTLTSDLAQGYALKSLTELLASFLIEDNIKQQFKGRLVGAVLNGYLSLRRLVVQRTRLIDETQEKLLELLEEMTSGTEDETRAFMKICIETVQRFSPQDVRTPVFVFERLCSIIHPEENDIGEFFLTLEKDPQQEDFLQGRMLGNPYSSNEPGLGPLMRDVKNKICQDCELVALLEDDNGMELLVNNKIMSLNLAVKDVYKRVWLAEGSDGDAMRVVYRMRGLLGDATEEFVETLAPKSEQEVDNEEAYKMANVMADCGGLQVMLERLAAIQDMGRSRPLLQVLLKLFRLCVKVERNQEVLTEPHLGAMTVFLDTLQLCLQAEADALTQQLLDIMETVLSKAAFQPLSTFVLFSQTFGGTEHIASLLSCTATAGSKAHAGVLARLAHVLAALTYGNTEKMALLCDHFKPALDFNRFDFDHSPEDQHKLELFCVLMAGIDRNAIGNTLKDYIMSLDIVKVALEYITMHAPCLKPTLLLTDSDEWKDYISKPALKFVLRFLTGLAADHPATQLAVAQDCIPIIHRLEQVSSDEHVGSLAENLLEALRTNPAVATRIEEVRKQTRAEKKRLAMAMREKQLGALGMHTNEKGQVTAKSSMLEQLEELGEETGLVCVICREGYKFQPSKVLGIYTFTKRCNVEDYENKARRTLGYSTVTHFNVVHVDCHMSAVRLARARDEWESAALQNANTKCNGLLPLWGPQVAESAFASCLARHNTYLQESTGHRDIGYTSTVHDLKLLLLRFAQEKSFHDDTGGGGPQSNMNIIPYLLHMALYVINTTRCGAREEKSLKTYIHTAPCEKWFEACYAADGPLYWSVLAILLHSPGKWNDTRISYLSRLMVLGHVRHVAPTPPAPPPASTGAQPPFSKLSDAEPKDYSVYKPYLIFFGLIDGIYNIYFKKVTFASEDSWSSALADYIRHNDEPLLRASERLMTTYREELLPCASFTEFCDILNLLDEIPNPDEFLSNLLRTLG